jgi:hypothetical protein
VGNFCIHCVLALDQGVWGPGAGNRVLFDQVGNGCAPFVPQGKGWRSRDDSYYGKYYSTRQPKGPQ